MIRLIKFFIFFYSISCGILFAQNYDRNNYQIIDFFEVSEYLSNKEKIDPKEISSLQITNMGYYHQFDFLKKFKNLENLLIIGDDYDDSLKTLPKELLKLKSLKRVFLDRLAFDLIIKHQIEKERPDIEVFWYDLQAYYGMKIIYHNHMNARSFIYPKKLDYPGSFTIDSLLKVKNKSILDLLEISHAYTNYFYNYGMQEYLRNKSLDSLYRIFGNEAYDYLNYKQIPNALHDTAKVSYYFKEAEKKDTNCAEVILYGIYYYKEIKNDSIRACKYYHKYLTQTDSLNFLIKEEVRDSDGNLLNPYYKYYLRLDEKFPNEGECYKFNPSKWLMKKNY